MSARPVRLEFLPQFHDVELERVGEPVVPLVPDVFINAGA